MRLVSLQCDSTATAVGLQCELSPKSGAMTELSAWLDRLGQPMLMSL